MRVQDEAASATAGPNKNVLISGASFAGLAMAYWMNRLGYDVTVVEIGEGLNRGGTPVNIGDDAAGIVKRMGLFEQIQANRLPMKSGELVNADDIAAGPLQFPQDTGVPEIDWEIERDTLRELRRSDSAATLKGVSCAPGSAPTCRQPGWRHETAAVDNYGAPDVHARFRFHILVSTRNAPDRAQRSDHRQQCRSHMALHSGAGRLEAGSEARTHRRSCASARGTVRGDDARSLG